MRDVHHAIDNLRQMTKLPRLDFDKAGNLSLEFDGRTIVNITKVSDGALELWSRLGGLGTPTDPELLVRLLEANHLGEGTGAARLALAPAEGRVVLCERVEVEPLSEAQFSARIIAFLKYVTFWNSAEGRALLAPRDSDTDNSPAATDTFVIRG